jgi:HD-GYP domain-containing protein (c-di-GMP phosphodiesterase class II)
MNNIYYYGKDRSIFEELYGILRMTYSFKEVLNFGEMEKDSVLIIDLTGSGENTWRSDWPEGLGSPKTLMSDNIRVMPVIKKSHLSFAMDLLKNDIDDFIQHPFDAPKLLGTLMNTIRDIEYEKELLSLYQIGIHLSDEMDLDELLKEILNVSISFTNSDGASLFLAIPETDPETGEKMMQFEIMVSDTLGNRYHKVKMPVNDRSLAGYVIKTGKNLNIFDAYRIPANAPYSFDPTLDNKNNYISRTMLVIPMIDHKNEIIGAIQLINKKKDRLIKLTSQEIVDESVIEYDHKNELLIRSLGSQATIAIETVKLYKDIQDLFESFMEASMMAVESRDPNTAGHSRRVSKLSVAMANHINLLNNGELSRYNFSINEIRSIKYAGLLHDFGKLGVPEKILLKDKKLFEEEILNIETRLELLKYSKNVHDNIQDVSRITEEVDLIKDAVLEANAHAKNTDELSKRLDEAVKSEITLLDGSRRPVLTCDEFDKLTLRSGSLSKEEFEFMKTHVEHTYNYLKLIKWPKGLERIPDISRYHHEKLDGSGYPLGLKGDDIPIESQILCISDIFDALTSKDRPYKKKISVDAALKILKEEADKGKLNPDIVTMLIESGIYNTIIDEEK